MRYYWEYRGSNNFNPRTSYEVRLGQHKKFQPQVDFNPRTSCEVRRQNYTKEFIFSSTKLFSVKFCVQALTSKLAYIFKTSKTITFSNANLTEKYVHFHFAISSRYLPADILALHQILLFSFHNYFLGNKNANYLFPD